ncbi:hypothetical protein J6590_000157 [Homalodisca vitripennis]|nr:hypothetical protein J6590_000157 [Homalodisca vitripennis]
MTRGTTARRGAVQPHTVIVDFTLGSARQGASGGGSWVLKTRGGDAHVTMATPWSSPINTLLCADLSLFLTHCLSTTIVIQTVQLRHRHTYRHVLLPCPDRPIPHFKPIRPDEMSGEGAGPAGMGAARPR